MRSFIQILKLQISMSHFHRVSCARWNPTEKQYTTSTSICPSQNKIFYLYLVSGVGLCAWLLPEGQPMLLMLRVVIWGLGPPRCPYKGPPRGVSTQVGCPMRRRGTVMWGSDGSILGRGSTVPHRGLCRWGFPIRRRFGRTRVSARLLGRGARWGPVGRGWP